MAEVGFDRVRKVYAEGVVAVEGATFQVADGELLVLVGPSGCGKSTLLRMVAGLEDISGGELRIGGRVVNNVAPRDRDIAMVFQNYALYPHMTVAENLGFALKLRKQPSEAIAARVKEAADMLGLGDLLQRRPAALSGGQRQRVALGRALVRQPQVFLLDEPLSNLDAKLRASTRVEIARLHRRLGTTMIYVTHDQIEAMTLGQRIVVLDGGRIEQIDTPMALYERPASVFVAGFLGSPAMNLVAGRLRRDDGLALHPANGDPPIPLDPASELPADAFDRDIRLGVRPEHLVAVVAGDEAGAFAADVEVVEPVGSEAYVNLRHGATMLVSRLPSAAGLPAGGSSLRLRLSPRHLHVFDADTGHRL
ncbi:MAG: sn-glycerol-3-phosphate ABC transporter ATP-binding protein UgpC [Thermomonas sp.]